MVKQKRLTVYQDATFFVKGQYDLKQVIKVLEKLDIDWKKLMFTGNGASNYQLYRCLFHLYMEWLINYFMVH